MLSAFETYRNLERRSKNKLRAAARIDSIRKKNCAGRVEFHAEFDP